MTPPTPADGSAKPLGYGEALDIVRAVLHGSTERGTVSDVRPALARLDELVAAHERVRELHPAIPLSAGFYCGACTDSDRLEYHPCPTVRALDEKVV